MIEDVRIDTDERGFILELHGDLVDAMEAYLRDPLANMVRFRLGGHEAIKLLAEAREHVEPYAAEMNAALREFTARLDEPDPAGGYEPDDPKSPGYHDRMAGVWDEREGK